jgi:hypothetical protein
MASRGRCRRKDMAEGGPDLGIRPTRWGACLYETRHLVRSVLSIEAAGGRDHAGPCSLPSGLIRTNAGYPEDAGVRVNHLRVEFGATNRPQ